MKGNLLLAVFVLSCCTPRDSLPAMETIAPAPPTRPAVVLPDGFVIEAEIAADEETRQQGLMFRESLAPGKGMLFLFPSTGVYPFWMKNTLIPLDIISIDDLQRVVYIGRDIPPCRADPCPSYPPGASARFVLELAAGQAAAHKLQVGDRLEIRNVDLTVAR